MISHVSIFFSLFVTIAGEKHEGPCPTIPVVENFDPNQYANGKWYSLYHNVDDQLHFFHNLKCIEKRAIYNPEGGTITFDTYGVNEVTNQPKWHRCYGYNTEISGVFKMVVANASYPFDTLEFRVVDVDYGQYAVAYACGYNTKENLHYVTAAISSRTHHLIPISKFANTVRLFQMYGLHFNFIPTDFSDCRTRCE